MDLRNKERPYYTVNDFFQDKFASKVIKIAVNGGFTCPNRDGTLSTKGCLFCSEMGAGDFAGDRSKPIREQFTAIKKIMNEKWPEGKYLVYFQADTNTYAPLEKLKSLFESALTLEKDLVGISVATRPDCLPEDVMDYLADLNRRTYLTVELGLQTIHSETARLINRGYELPVFEDALKRLRKVGIEVVIHVINGLPGETKAMMLQTVEYLNRLDIQGIKLHMLYIARNSPMASYYENHPFPLLTLWEYVDVVADQLERLRETIVIHRMTGDAPRDLLIAPEWTKIKFVVTNEIDKEMRRRNSCQGALAQPYPK